MIKCDMKSVREGRMEGKDWTKIPWKDMTAYYSYNQSYDMDGLMDRSSKYLG